MASSSIRLRRTLTALSSTLHRSLSSSSPATPIHRAILSTPIPQFQTRSFKSSPISLLSTRHSSFSNNNIPDEIGPDTILFEGCDYNHWLFVMDFPRDNTKPSPEEMVRIYEQTCAKGLNISVEEAKKKIYACSTTIYTGFQAVMTEEESKKFESLPEVIFVLPDSYIDPVNKQYGGDQYINGTIIPRPPPVQYGKNQRIRDDRRGPGRYNQQGNQMSNPQGNFSYDNRRPMQGDGRNYGPPQNYHQPQQNHGQASQNSPPQQNYGQASQNYPPQQNYGQASQNYPPQQNYGQASQNYPPQQNYGQASQNYPPQQNYGQASQNYTQHHPRHQGNGPASPQYAPQQNFGPPGQGERRDYVPQQNFGPPGQGERRDPAPRPGGTGASKAFEEEGSFTPSYMKDFKPSYMEEFEQFGQSNQRNYPPKEQTGSQQGQGNFTGEGRY
ncbi:hypothetical protein RIF29_41752 [Crotalaria pallida]|uniref:MORF/ORRM1/DAG-like MORF domain-containing protein n=1 Tax=Crotalaria pallida TaxID=3830 RepID=A0AAN9E7Y2_CROPI